MRPVHRLFGPSLLKASVIVAATLGGPAWAADECPNHPESTYTLTGDPDSDQSQLEALAEPAKARGAVCIEAYYDGAGPANSKMMAFRRANWAMAQLTTHGVPAGIIARALRASDKANARRVQVILGP
jgi:hypothetical protein